MHPDNIRRPIFQASPTIAYLLTIFAWLALWNSIHAAEPLPAPSRLWVSNDGQYLRGQIVDVQDGIAILQDDRDRRFEIRLIDLSIEDQRHAAQFQQSQANQQEPPPLPQPERAEPAEPAEPAKPPRELPKAVRTLQRLLRANLDMQKQDGDSPLFGDDSSVYIAFSSKFLNDFIQVPIDHQRDVEETILGTPVAGTANTRGMATLVLRPNPDHADFEVVVQGRADSVTAGQQLIVNIESSGTTHFEAKKRVKISTQGVQLYEATATADTQVTQSAVSTPLGGRIGSLVGRIAGTIVEANRPQIDYEASERAAYRAAKDLDDRIDSEVARVQEVLSEIAPGMAAGEPVIPIRFRTSSDRLAILVGAYEPAEWSDFDAYTMRDGEDIAVVLPKKTVATAQQLQMAMKLMSISLEEQLGNIKPEELAPKSQSWSADREWLTLVWDVNGTVVELLSKDFIASTTPAAQTPAPSRPPTAQAPAAVPNAAFPNAPRWNQLRPRAGGSFRLRP